MSLPGRRGKGKSLSEMGTDYEGQEGAIEEVRALSPRAKELLAHHFNNSLAGIIGGLEIGDSELAMKAAKHMIEDLRLFGIRPKSSYP
jgi:hypothetical protein